MNLRRSPTGEELTALAELVSEGLGAIAAVNIVSNEVAWALTNSPNDYTDEIVVEISDAEELALTSCIVGFTVEGDANAAGVGQVRPEVETPVGGPGFITMYVHNIEAAPNSPTPSKYVFNGADFIQVNNQTNYGPPLGVGTNKFRLSATVGGAASGNIAATYIRQFVIVLKGGSLFNMVP